MLAKLFHRSHFDMMFYVKDCVCVCGMYWGVVLEKYHQILL